MTGFGAALWGMGRFGVAIPVIGSMTIYSPPLALLYDIRTRSFPLNPDGTFQGVHPVDQQMALALGIINGAIKGVSSQGTQYSSLSRLSAGQIQTQAENIVHQQKIISQLVRNGDVTIQAISTTVLVAGNNQVGVAYINNHTKRQEFTNG